MGWSVVFGPPLFAVLTGTFRSVEGFIQVPYDHIRIFVINPILLVNHAHLGKGSPLGPMMLLLGGIGPGAALPINWSLATSSIPISGIVGMSGLR